MASGSKTVVYAAVAGNLAIAVMKFAAAFTSAVSSGNLLAVSVNTEIK